MSKKRILWNMIGACMMTWVGLGFLIPTLMSAQWVCQKTGVNGINCQARPESLGQGFTTAMVLFGVAGILSFIAWIGALVRTIRMHDWIWTVLLILGSGIATLIYALVSANRPRRAVDYPPPASIPLPPLSERTPTPVS